VGGLTHTAPGLPDRYQVEAVVGRGGFGEVVRAQDRELVRPVAIKRLRGGDAEVRARFRREAQRTAALRHPHVIEVLDYGEDDSGAPYLVYEWVEGRDLRSLLASGERPPPATLRAWGAAIAEALDAAHRAGVIHRDVKPANVLLRDDGHVLLADLGIARVAGGETVRTAEGLLLGTPAFMAPELWHGESASPASDQWAWAASLELLAGGAAPWGSEEVEDILGALRRSPCFQAEAPDLDADLRQALTRGLAADPAARFPDMASFAAALRGEDAAAPAATVVTPAPDLTASTRRLDSRQPVTAPQVPRPPAGDRRPALALVALLGLGLAWALTSSPEPQPTATAPPAPTRPEQEPTEAALEEATARLLPDHRNARGAYRQGRVHQQAFRKVWGHDTRAPLLVRRWFQAARDWLATRPTPWQTCDPDGPTRELYWEVRRRVSDPLRHFLDDLQQLRAESEGAQATLDQLVGTPGESYPHARANDLEVLADIEVRFRRHLGPPTPGVARLELEAILAATAVADDFGASSAPADLRTRRRDTLGQLHRALASDLGPLTRLQLATASAPLMLNLRIREVVDAEVWDGLLASMASSLDASPAPGTHAPRVTLATKLAVAKGVLLGIVKGSRILRRPASPEAWASGRRALTWMDDTRELSPEEVLRVIQEIRRWMEKRRIFMTPMDAGDVARLREELEALETTRR
jgi:hypothetical protein